MYSFPVFDLKDCGPSLSSAHFSFGVGVIQLGFPSIIKADETLM